jgi:hypothetical protein
MGGRPVQVVRIGAAVVELVRQGAPGLSRDQVDADVSGAVMVSLLFAAIAPAVYVFLVNRLLIAAGRRDHVVAAPGRAHGASRRARHGGTRVPPGRFGEDEPTGRLRRGVVALPFPGRPVRAGRTGASGCSPADTTRRRSGARWPADRVPRQGQDGNGT